MGNLLRTEWYKLRKDRTFWVLSAFLIVFAILYPLLINTTDDISGNDYYRGDILSINTDIVRLFPAILAGFFIANEYAIGTMKSIVSSGNSRIRLYFAKLTVFSVGSMIIMLILPIVMLGASLIYKGSHIMPEWTFFFQTISLIALYAVAFASIMAFFSTILTNSGKAIGFLLLFLALSGSLFEYLAAKISFLKWLITHSIFLTNGSILTIDKIDHWSGETVFTFVLVPILTFLVFGFLGSFIYRKKEIK